jgi:5-oxoprolinase (ATP-hydrolysing)
MDDGTEIVLEVRINGEQGTAEFDWTGTGPQVYGNVSGKNSMWGLRSLSGVWDVICGPGLIDVLGKHTHLSLLRRHHLRPPFHDQP